jgi:branched-chain amino acid transport system substrate-binding protein
MALHRIRDTISFRARRAKAMDKRAGFSFKCGLAVFIRPDGRKGGKAMKLAARGIVAVLAAVLASSAYAAGPVKIGVIYPLTGNAASAGQSARDAVHLGVDIVNTGHPELKNLPLAATGGLPNLGSAKIELDEADHQGNPQVGQQQTLRLISQDHVVAMLGSYHSSVSLVATAVAERQGIPYLVADSVASNITGRGFKWTFRTTPIAPDFAKAYFAFLNDLKKSGRKIDTIAVVNENTDYGTSVGASVVEAAKSANIKVGAQIAYNANSSDVTAQVLQLKSLQPDAVVFISYTADIILYFKTMKNLDYLPPVIIGDDAGFSDPAFIPNAGDLAQGAINRSAFDIGKPGSSSYIVDQMFKAKYGRDLDDTSARWMQGFFVLADAINRAGSTEPDKIQAALKATDLKPDQLIMGYNGVKFDATGQNILSATYLIQLQGKQYVSVWPEDRATAKLELPMEGWRK